MPTSIPERPPPLAPEQHPTAADDRRPTAASQSAALRQEVLRFKARSPRGLVPPSVRVGALGGPSVGPVLASGMDAHLRMETATVLCDRIRERVPAPLPWLTRSGSPAPAELDESWWAAIQAAWPEQGLAPVFAVVTRQGWRWEPGGVLRQWRRVRAT